MCFEGQVHQLLYVTQNGSFRATHGNPPRTKYDIIWSLKTVLEPSLKSNGITLLRRSKQNPSPCETPGFLEQSCTKHSFFKLYTARLKRKLKNKNSMKTRHRCCSKVLEKPSQWNPDIHKKQSKSDSGPQGVLSAAPLPPGTHTSCQNDPPRSQNVGVRPAKDSLGHQQ